ncbi:MAG TPA: RNA polymerase subunit sigma-70 [Flavobacteriaceae bacterium]|nr:RNA polymerase subunit sigma-70 [Flavobacteriaceae bacterium]HBR54851.1 RNA polymerase subunit sigma-70 [Flavobacteriaceae bacterium]|tara:strand:- start:1215 stop:1724 length:510 start_codon:yes stop_codon:yes gene_type:complete
MEEKTNVCKEHMYDKVYREYAETIRNFIYFKCGDKDKAHDIAQEAFIKLWENCKKVPPQKAKSFLYTVANNLFLNTVAHKKVVLKYVESHQPRVEKHSPQFLLEEKEYGERLQNAIANLTEIQRTAFLLSRVEGKKYREIAEILNISEKATSKRIHDALEALRKTVEKI